MELSRTRKRQYDNIIGKAKILFMKQGIDGTSMKEIADLAGVERKTVYNYFPTKDDLATNVLVNLEQMNEWFFKISHDESSTKSGYERLKEILLFWAENYNDYKEALVFSYHYDYYYGKKLKLHDRINIVESMAKNPLGYAVKRGLEDKSIKLSKLDWMNLAFVISSGCIIFIRNRLYREHIVDIEVNDVLIKEYILMLLKGLKA